jgi:fatty acid desaturase
MRNLAGNPDAWGSPHTLWLLPALATVLYLVFTAIGSRPGAFRFPVRVTFQNRDRLQALARQMTAFLKAETVLLLAILQYAILHAFRTSHFSLPAWLIPSGVAVLLLTTLVHIAAMRRAG